MRRFGKVIKLKEDQFDAYKKLHDGAGVRDLLTAISIRHFNIFLQRVLDGEFYEFACYEYTGDNFDAYIARLASEPRNKEWHRLCDPMQNPFPGSTGWSDMEQIFFNA